MRFFIAFNQFSWHAIIINFKTRKYTVYYIFPNHKLPMKIRDVWLGCCKLENKILKEAKNLNKSPKMIILTPKNVIFDRFWPVSTFHFPACSTLCMIDHLSSDCMFYRYHVCLMGLMSYVPIMCGALLAYPIYGQHESSSYCDITGVNMISSAGFKERQQRWDIKIIIIVNFPKNLEKILHNLFCIQYYEIFFLMIHFKVLWTIPQLTQ